VEVRVTPWPAGLAPTEQTLRGLMEAEGLNPYTWGNEPFDTYAAHSHQYDKVIFVVRGSITFGLPGEGRRIELGPGDRLDLPAGTVHEAAVGAQGVSCLEAHRRENRLRGQ
jgi:quercetin dioxygenase-like cupin family protein